MQAEWIKAVKALGTRDAKWSKLSVPGSLVRFARTRLELSIMSIPDPKVRQGACWCEGRDVRVGGKVTSTDVCATLQTRRINVR